MTGRMLVPGIAVCALLGSAAAGAAAQTQAMLQIGAFPTESEADAASARLQETTAKRLGFQFTGHKMELYGICRDCRKARQVAG